MKENCFFAMKTTTIKRMRMFLAVAFGLVLTPPANLKAMAETARTV